MTDDHGAPGNIPPGLRVPRNQMSRRAIRYWSALAALQGLGLLGAELGIEAAFGLGPGCWTAFGASAFVVLGYVLAMPRWRYRVHRWEVTDEALYTRAGWFSVHWRIAPINRIQTIDSHRSCRSAAVRPGQRDRDHRVRRRATCTSTGWTGPRPTGCLTS